ncbi:MAG: DUF2508 domain-containing protein [Firmicutes bacterium HGW-Firmicutes-1]|jgi:hypothetical protein|nr:MAG: DUF2508 domain-containing protein [Firmicutes bacterium HGW-Firmicutes-1]
MKSNSNYQYSESDLKNKVTDDQTAIILSIEKVKKALECAYANFDFVSEPELVDSYIYEVKAIQLKYQYLIQQAKSLGIISDKIEYTCKKNR